MFNFIKSVRSLAVAVALTAVSAGAFATPIFTVVNGGFENPVQPAGGFSYLAGQTINGWTYTGGSGVATNNSPFNLTNATGQAAILQQISSISQSFNLAQDSTFLVSFDAEARGFAQGGNNISVLVDGIAMTFAGLTSILPTSTTSFVAYTSDLFNLAAGDHTLSFVGYGAGGGDVTTFVDNVVGTAVPVAIPEPASLALLGLGLLAVGVAGRKSNQRAK